jgi:hypothetical protein
LGFIIVEITNHYIRFATGNVPLNGGQIEQLFIEIGKYQAQGSKNGTLQTHIGSGVVVLQITPDKSSFVDNNTSYQSG